MLRRTAEGWRRASVEGEALLALLAAGGGRDEGGRQQMGRKAGISKGRRGLVKPRRETPATEVMEWLDGVLADPDLARAVEERLVEMRAEQKREAARARGLSGQARDVPRQEPTRRGNARGRREASSAPGRQTPFIVGTPYPDLSATARRLGVKGADVARLDEFIESSRGGGATQRRRAKDAPRRRPE